MPTLETFKGAYLWKYLPSLPVAIIFAALFLLVTIAHTWKLIKYRTWYCSAFVIGGICEVTGYCARIWSRYDTGSLIPFLIQAITILIAPILFAAGLYIVYGRTVRGVRAEKFSPLSPRACTYVFLIGDQLCLNIQSTGAGFLSKPHLQNLADGIIIAGLALQVVLFMVFMFCCLVFQRRYRAHLAATDKLVTVKWEAVVYMLYGTSVLVSLRNVFRLVEFSTGSDGYLLTHEWTLYVFDAAPMFLTMAVFHFWCPPPLDKTRSAEDFQLMGGENISL